MRVAGTRDGQHFTEPVIESTPETPEEGLALFARIARDVAGDDTIEGLFGGITGVWNKDRTALVHSPNMAAWTGKPLRSLIEKELSAPLVVENDADVVGLGEVHAGAGRGSAVCVYITVSTGVGGARIVDGVIDRAVVGFEPGHHIIDRSRLNNGELYEATLEGHISGTSLERRSGRKPYDVTDPDVWEELSAQTAIGVYNSILFWSPDRVVLGGSMIVGDPAIPVDRIRHHTERLGSFLPELPEIRKAELGSVGGLHGALALSRMHS